MDRRPRCAGGPRSFRTVADALARTGDGAPEAIREIRVPGRADANVLRNCQRRIEFVAHLRRVTTLGRRDGIFEALE